MLYTLNALMHIDFSLGMWKQPINMGYPCGQETKLLTIPGYRYFKQKPAFSQYEFLLRDHSSSQ